MPSLHVRAPRDPGLPRIRLERLVRELRLLPMPRLLGRRTPGGPTIHVDEYRDQDTEVIRADLPGLHPEDVALTVRSGLLRIDAERRVERGEHERPVRRETRYGNRTRTLPLPTGATPDGITTTYEDGVLEIRVPVPRPPAVVGPAEVPRPPRAGRRPFRPGWRTPAPPAVGCPPRERSGGAADVVSAPAAVPTPRAAPDPRVWASARTPPDARTAAPSPAAPPDPAPRVPGAPPHRSHVRSADGRLWELVIESTGVTAVTAAGTVAEARVSERGDRVVLEFWTDGRDPPSDLCAEFVGRVFALPAVRAHRPVVVSLPRRDGAVLVHARRHVQDARTRAAGATCFLEGRVGTRPGGAAG